MNTIMRTVGGAFGAQIAAAIVTGHLEPGTSFPKESGFTEAFAMGSIALLVALAAAALIPGRRARTSHEAVPELAHQTAGTVAQPARPS
jgi:hypothetical protein